MELGTVEDDKCILQQAACPPFHRNLYRAVQRDYGDTLDPSTPVFLRGYALGLAAEAGPRSLALLLAVILQARQAGLSRQLLKRTARRWTRLVKDALGKRGLAFFLGASLGGTEWLEPRILAILRWATKRYHRGRQSAVTEGKSGSGTDNLARERREQQIATFLATMVSTWCAFGLQIPERPSRRHAPASDLPLVAFPTLSKHSAASTTSVINDPTIQNAARRYESPTLDFTLFLLVRAVDTALRAAYTETRLAGNKIARLIAEKGDTALFVLSAWRIMFVWFYKPWLLPPQYNQWIHSLAQIDPRLLQLLRHLRREEWVYGQVPLSGAAKHIGPSLCLDLGLPAELGMPEKISQFPCQAAHGALGNTAICEVNLARRWLAAWKQAMTLYAPVHFLPVLLFSYRKVLRSPRHMLARALLGSSRSAAFLATFVSAVWAGVCYGRTRLGPRLIPNQQLWDGGLAMMLGTFICGFSVLIENKRRRGEMALFVAPRALYAVLDEILPSFLVEGSKLTELLERFVFSLSAATVMTASVYKPEHIRGIVRSLAALLIGEWEPPRARLK